MAKLILVEGIAGSGKSTTAGKLKQTLSAQGTEVRLFQEGDLHPCDLAWHACVPLAVYEDLLDTFSEHKHALGLYTSLEQDTAYVAYTKLELSPNHPLFTELNRYEPYQGRVPLGTFRELHLSRWHTFAERVKEDEAVYIFECAYLQNHVSELMLTYEASPEAIAAHMQALAETVRSLEPCLIYLSPTGIAWVIDHAAETRKSEHPEWKDWFDQVIDYVKNSNYGKTNGVTGRAGVLEFFRRRHLLELDILEGLPIEHHVHEVGVDFAQPSTKQDLKLLSALAVH